MSEKSAVILVDHRTRDLMGSVLLAHHLEKRGVCCHLEPLESYHGCLAAFAPDLILFNHINSSHLVKYSHRLHSLNVLTAVLPNEGILYHEDTLRYNSGRFHKGSHMDFYFCWNDIHQRALREEGPGGKDTRIEVVGVPRFDLYFKPWSHVFDGPPRQPGARPRILLCTNLAFARYEHLSDADAAKFFAPFLRIPLYADYKSNIQAHIRSRAKLMIFLQTLAESGEFDVLLRPHPREEASWYAERIAAWPETARARITMDSVSIMPELMLNCDLEISCETCTTAMEAWIARKPAVELIFERHPLFFHDNQARLNVLCEDPATIVETLKHELANPAQAGHAEGRHEHLATWCHTPDGRASERLAEMLAEAIHAKPPVKKQFTLAERRKAAKLKLLRALDLPYNFAPLLPLKARLNPADYSTKWMAYRKTIRPSDVTQARARLAEAMRVEEGSAR